MILVITDIEEFKIADWFQKHNDLLILFRDEKNNANVAQFLKELGKGPDANNAVKNVKSLWSDILRKLKKDQGIKIDEIEYVLIHVGGIDRCAAYEPYTSILDKKHYGPNDRLIQTNYYSCASNACNGYLEIYHLLQTIYTGKNGKIDQEDREKLKRLLEKVAYFLPMLEGE